MKALTAAAPPFNEAWTMARILIVDDEPEFVEMLSRVFVARGHTIDTARDSAQALDALQALMARVERRDGALS